MGEERQLFLTEFQLISVEKIREMKNYPQNTSQNCCRQGPPMVAKISA